VQDQDGASAREGRGVRIRLLKEDAGADDQSRVPLILGIVGALVVIVVVAVWVAAEVRFNRNKAAFDKAVAAGQIAEALTLAEPVRAKYPVAAVFVEDHGKAAAAREDMEAARDSARVAGAEADAKEVWGRASTTSDLGQVAYLECNFLKAASLHEEARAGFMRAEQDALAVQTGRHTAAQAAAAKAVTRTTGAAQTAIGTTPKGPTLPKAVKALPSDGKYTVKKGDTLWNLGQKFGLTVDQIKKLNSLKDDKLQIGQVLVLGPAVQP
jgi:nucleoid-associated protein YgaU